MSVRKDGALAQGAMMRESDLSPRWMLQVRHGFQCFSRVWTIERPSGQHITGSLATGWRRFVLSGWRVLHRACFGQLLDLECQL
jgi:hypothetical protein